MNRVVQCHTHTDLDVCTTVPTETSIACLASAVPGAGSLSGLNLRPSSHATRGRRQGDVCEPEASRTEGNKGPILNICARSHTNRRTSPRLGARRVQTTPHATQSQPRCARCAPLQCVCRGPRKALDDFLGPARASGNSRPRDATLMGRFECAASRRSCFLLADLLRRAVVAAGAGNRCGSGSRVCVCCGRSTPG